MTLFDFQLLPVPEQAAVLYAQGVYIGKRKTDNQFALLYQVDSFYAEVFYRKYRHHILKIKSSASTALLDPYLEQISVEHLVS